MKLRANAYLIISSFLFASCNWGDNTLFVEVPASTSTIDFSNNIEENVDFNILTYEYLYNGGGVAAGDLNNDGLVDLVFSGNMTPSKVYLNKGNFKFQDVSARSGFVDRPRWKTGVVMSDVNGDGWQDIYLCYSGPGTDEERKNQLFINKGTGKDSVPQFEEAAAKYGLDAAGTYSTTALFFDMDNDDDLDMFLVNHADMFYNPFFNTEQLRSKRHPKFGNRLYRNDDDIFHDVSDSAGIFGSGLNFGLSVSASDINNDGWTDLYVTNDYDERDFLYLNNRNGTFSEVLDKTTGHISEFVMGSDIADYNNDGKSDIVVLDMLPEDNHRQKLLKGADSYDKYTTRVAHGFHHQQMRNTLQLNNGIDSASGLPIFSEVGQLAGMSKTDWSWAPLLADFDNDGWKDLFISNGIYKDITNLDFVKYTSGYSNNFSDKKGDKVQMWQLIGEMPSTKLGNYFYRNNGNLGFTNVSSSWLPDDKQISNGSAYADLDNDGDLDLVISRLNEKPLILRNQSVDNGTDHFVRIKLSGAGKNTDGIGAKVWVRSASFNQYYEVFPTRGFQSSVSPLLNIGLGKDSVIEQIRIEWPGDAVTVLSNLRANSIVEVSAETARMQTQVVDDDSSIFADVTRSAGINYLHRENRLVDFKVAPLLPFQVSKTGPCLAAGDANGDGLDDVFIGAASPQGGELYLQNNDGSFALAAEQPWNRDKKCTITSALFFDADKDGDQDLYLVSGGSTYPARSDNYQDRVFVNEGKGQFVRASDALPIESLSGGVVSAGDLDNDGLLDLYVGSRFTPGAFPVASESLLLKNNSEKDKLHFVVAKSKDTLLSKPGMVSDAVWTDLDKDGWTDLVVVGLFMPVTVFINQHGELVNETNRYGLANTSGWWQRIVAGDFDNNGFTDLVVGNIGTNTNFNASPEQPLTLTYGDMNGDGVIDPILCTYNGGKSYPYLTRDELLDQLPGLQKKFGRYSDYADAGLTDIFSADQLAKTKTLTVNNCSSVLISNNGKGQLVVKALPRMAQLSMVNGIVTTDADGDGKMDIIIAGNFFPMRVQQGPLDASIGLLLKGSGDGNFVPRPFSSSGLKVPGDVRQMIAVKAGGRTTLLAAKSNDSLQAVQINK